MIKKSSLFPLAVVFSGLVSGCGPAMTVEEPGMDAFPSDSEIFSIALAVHETAIAANRDATSRARHEVVRELATQIVDDHHSALEQLRALDMPTVDHPLIARVQERGREAMAEFEQHRRTSFDRAYLDAQMPVTRRAVDFFDGFLIPSARSEQLTMILEQQRAVMDGHLAQVLHVRAAIDMR